VASATKADILQIVPEKRRFIFDKGSEDSKVKEKILSRFRDISSLARSEGKQLKLLYNDGTLSVQRASAIAKQQDSHVYVKKITHRISDAGATKKLGAPVKFIEQVEWVENFIIDRFERGDAVTREEVYTAVRGRWHKTLEKAFQNILHDQSHLRKWLTRAPERMKYSDRSGSISQKVPLDWKNIAVQTAERICQQGRLLEVDNILAMDETFILYHLSASKVLVPTGIKRVGSLIPVANEKKGVTLVVTASLLSSQLLPPFIVDSGGFGSTLMHQWKHYTKSTVLFNATHWMTQYIFILYLEWVSKMFPTQRIMLIIDRSTTHYGKIIDDWIVNHNKIELGGRIFLEYIHEGMTSVQQVCDIAVNKPLKALIKQQYYRFRMECIGDLSAKDLVGSVFAVPREDLVGMIESSFDEINNKNRQRRWIAAAFAQCGQDPWIEDQSKFHEHLTTLGENSIYQHMIKATSHLKLQ
jgi:hypothetical protein